MNLLKGDYRIKPVTTALIHLGNAYSNEKGTFFRIEAVTYDGWPHGPATPPLEVRFVRVRDGKAFIRPGAEVRQQIESEKLVLEPDFCMVDFRTETTKSKNLITIEIFHETSENQFST